MVHYMLATSTIGRHSWPGFRMAEKSWRDLLWIEMIKDSRDGSGITLYLVLFFYFFIEDITCILQKETMMRLSCLNWLSCV